MEKMTLYASSRKRFQTEDENNYMSTATCIAEIPFFFFSEPRPKDSMVGVASEDILIVDDDVETRTSMRKGLEAYGYQCKEAEDGLIALRQMRTHHYNVVLTDLNLPFLDGLGLAQHLSEDPSLGNPMVILMTSSRTDMITRLALTFGIQEILSKPCLPSSVDRMIHPQPIKFPRAA